MTTPMKRWPNNAEWARCDCIALAGRGRATLIEMLDDVNDPAILRRMAKAIDMLREIESKLRAVGPQSQDKEI